MTPVELDQECDDDAHEAHQLATNRCELEDPYRHAPLGSEYSDD